MIHTLCPAVASGVAAAAGHGEGAAVRAFALLAELQVETNPDAPGVVATATGAGIALFLLVLLRFVTGHTVTLFHEAGHAFTAVLLGGEAKSLKIMSNQTGVTGTVHPEGWKPFDFAILAGSGYIAPPLFGLAAAQALAHDLPQVVIWGTVVILAVLLPSARSLFTFFTIVTLGTVFVVVGTRGDDQYLLLSALAWTWILIAGGLFQVFEDFDGASDFDRISKKYLGPMFWALLYTVLIVVVVIEAGLVLVGAKEPFL
jgi:hypothetical protein